MHDLIIIGAGPAGITASIYAARKKMDFIVISEDVGGQTAWSGDVENYTGYQFISGPELAAKFEEHMRKFAIILKENERVLSLEKISGIVKIITNKGAYESKSVIVASGKRSKELGVSGEKEFKNKGLTYCATCDGPLFADKDVAVIGGGNSALDAVLQLMKISRRVHVINITRELGGDAVMRDKVMAGENVSVYNNSRVTDILGDEFVNAIQVVNQAGNAREKLAVRGVFVEIGLMPNSDFVQGVSKNKDKEIIVNCNNQTDVPGIFAAGDVTDVFGKQVVIAAGEGAKATLNASRYLMQA